jgi:hypothetical protein
VRVGRGLRNFDSFCVRCLPAQAPQYFGPTHASTVVVVSRLGAGDVNIESDSSCDLSSFSSGANREVVNIELSESTIGAMLVLSSAVFPTRV